MRRKAGRSQVMMAKLVKMEEISEWKRMRRKKRIMVILSRIREKTKI